MLQGGKFDKKGRWSGNTALASGDTVLAFTTVQMFLPNTPPQTPQDVACVDSLTLGHHSSVQNLINVDKLEKEMKSMFPVLLFIFSAAFAIKKPDFQEKI